MTGFNRIDEASNPDGVFVRFPDLRENSGVDTREGEAEGAVTPGALVKQGTNDYQLTECADGDTNVVGVAGENVRTEAGETPNLRADHDDGEWLRAYRGAGLVWMAILDNDENIDPETKLAPGTNGRVREYVPTTASTDNDTPESMVAEYIGDSTVSTGTSETTRILARWEG